MFRINRDHILDQTLRCQYCGSALGPGCQCRQKNVIQEKNPIYVIPKFKIKKEKTYWPGYSYPK